VNKRTFIIIFNIIIFLVEVNLLHLLMSGYLEKDYIKPEELTFYEYLLNKISNLV